MPASALTVNVKDKGAKGDGQADDTAAIQAALDEAAGSGGRVWIPAGTYMIDATVNACGGWGQERCGLQMRSGVTVHMSQQAVLKAMPNGSRHYNIFHFNDVENAHVLGGHLQGERYAHRIPTDGRLGEWGAGLVMRGARHAAIENVTAREFWGDGFYVGGSSQNVKFCAVVADKNRRQGMSITDVDTIVVQDSVFKNTHGTPPQDGIDIEPWGQENEPIREHVKNVTIRRSQFINNAGRGIGMVTTHPGQIENVVLEGNTFIDNSIGLGLGNRSWKTRITGNRIINSQYRNIGLGPLATFITVTDNAVTGQPGAALDRLIVDEPSADGSPKHNTIANNRLDRLAAVPLLPPNAAPVAAPAPIPPAPVANPSPTPAPTAGQCAPMPAAGQAINVRDKGAKGDGRSDDTAAIQAAIDQAAGTNGMVWVPEGTYLIDPAKRLFMRSHMTLRLAEQAVLKAKPASAGFYDIVRFEQVENAHLVGGTVLGERHTHQGAEGAWGTGVMVAGSRRIVIEQVKVQDAWGDGLAVAQASRDVRLCNVVAEGNRRRGLAITSAQDVLVQGGRYHSTHGVAPMTGIDIRPGKDETIHNVRITQAHVAGNRGYGIYAGVPYEVSASSARVSGVQIEGNTFEPNYLRSVTLERISGSSIRNNRLWHTGLWLTSTTSGNTVTGNHIHRHTILDQGTGNSISGNTIFNP